MRHSWTALLSWISDRRHSWSPGRCIPFAALPSAAVSCRGCIASDVDTAVWCGCLAAVSTSPGIGFTRRIIFQARPWNHNCASKWITQVSDTPSARRVELSLPRAGCDGWSPATIPHGSITIFTFGRWFHYTNIRSTSRLSRWHVGAGYCCAFVGVRSLPMLDGGRVPLCAECFACTSTVSGSV